MKKTQFFVEIKNRIAPSDLKNLRMLYTPILGIEAISLYQLLLDYHHINSDYNSYYSLDEIIAILGISREKILNSRKKLEAVGLIRTFEKNDGEFILLMMLQPMDPNQFRNNSLLYKNAVAKIGEIIFERLEFSCKEKVMDKQEFYETTIKYQDMFDLSIPKIDNSMNTLEIALPSVNSKEDAISGLNYSQFIFYLTGNKVSPSQLGILQKLSNLGFSNKSLNTIINYSNEINSTVVANHVKKIAEDFYSKDISGYQEIKSQLEKALNSRKSIEKPKTPKISKKFDENEEPAEWSEIFDSLGGGL